MRVRRESDAVVNPVTSAGAHSPELIPRVGVAQASNADVAQSARLRECLAPQGNGPTRVSGISTPFASASQTSSSSVMEVPRETTAPAWPVSAGAVSEHTEFVSQTLNAGQASGPPQ